MGFDPEWLTLREPADGAARDAALLRRAVALAGPGGCVLDLGCGTGSTLRAFEGAGATGAHWRLLDNDADLLARAAVLHPQAEICEGDLAEIDALPLDGVRLVTASALFDLVSRGWVERLAARLAAEGTAMYAALSYDGVMCWSPQDADDAAVTARFNAHQRGDKGFGAALGPDAAAVAAEIFEGLGYEVHLAPSAWRLGPEAAPMQRLLLAGIAQAAGEAGFAGADGWRARRARVLAEGWAEIGHLDLLALPLGDGQRG
ncbi:MAG: class I SAM-dependent methyltransferase [Roseovarius sp.]|uniref:class I SAM-dependent methyltransferase n=1 Tax=Roseovarius sp. TaxID=1486281 RepID=UPI001B78B8F2|nr:class I SAM-dependent methyltransferase [Roseovarius sp.]MBQ0752279.1 class I SAM-dependent methyltransferase [Roseovarius sp.]MBQ0808586.1 class I SAM-dependent methyltransferase [Roseovarius sp.]